jgi:hypothetical protein
MFWRDVLLYLKGSIESIFLKSDIYCNIHSSFPFANWVAISTIMILSLVCYAAGSLTMKLNSIAFPPLLTHKQYAQLTSLQTANLALFYWYY